MASSRSCRNPSSSKGFTLVELMVVLLIMAIAAAIVVPSLASTSDFQALSAARMIVADLQYAQDAAITTQSDVTVDFDTENYSYTLSNQSGPLVHPMTKGAYTIAFPAMHGFKSVRLAAAFGAGGHSVTFDVTGSPDQAGMVTVLAGSYQHAIRLSEGTGTVSVD